MIFKGWNDPWLAPFLAVVVVGLYALITVTEPWPEECTGIGLYCFLEQWQTLIAGALALAGASIAWFAAKAQTRESQRQFRLTQIEKIEREIEEIEGAIFVLKTEEERYGLARISFSNYRNGVGIETLTYNSFYREHVPFPAAESYKSIAAPTIEKMILSSSLHADVRRLIDLFFEDYEADRGVATAVLLLRNKTIHHKYGEASDIIGTLDRWVTISAKLMQELQTARQIQLDKKAKIVASAGAMAN